MDEDSSSASANRRTVSAVSAQKACEECRARKIRCDRNRPCSHCRAANLVCRNNTQPTEARARVTISKQYENKIDRIENRLANIERLLQNGASASSSPADAHRTPSSFDSHGNKKTKREIATAEYLDDDSAVATPFAGYTSMQAESLAAKDAFEQTVGSSPSITQDGQLKEALSSLQTIVGRLKGDGAAGPAPVLSAQSPEASTATEALVPPWDQIKALIERAKPNPPSVFAMCLPCTTFTVFIRKCEEMHDRPEDAPLCQQLLVYCGLNCLAAEYSTLEDDQAEYYDRLSRSFQRLILKVIANFPLALSPNWDNIEALLAAATICIDMCKPSLSWTLTSVAARLGQVLGYHRISALVNDTPQERNSKLAMFWMTYIMDRNTSLRVGRAPCIQDYDVDVPRPQPSETLSRSMIYLLDFWIDVAKVQGKICSLLYSPGGLSQPIEERSRLVDELAAELKRAFDARLKANDAILPIFLQPDGDTMAVYPLLEGDSIMHYSALTLVLHAIPAARPDQSPALEAARQCLRIGRDLRSNYGQNEYLWAGYCHWVVMHNPLTPFTVVFGNIIANPNGAVEDLQLLKDYVASLEPARRVSEGVEKFYQLCSVFWKVADSYARAKVQENSRGIPHARSQVGQNQWSQPLTGDFDEYLSALGFAPQPAVPAVSNDMNAVADQDMSNYLADWYTGNVSLYGLMEQDIDNMGMNFDMPTDNTWTANGQFRR